MYPYYNSPKVSIIVPVYGVEKYIERCCITLFSQSYENLEIIFVDDKTKDNSISIIESVLKNFENRKAQVSVIHHQENKGLSSARETGIQAATGEFITHVDSDDFIETDFIELCIKKALNENLDTVITGTWHEYADKKIADFSACGSSDIKTYTKGIIAHNYPSNIWGKIYKTSLYKDNDIHCIPGISYGEDYAVLPKLIYCSTKIGFIRKPLYHYVHYNSGSFTNLFKWKNLEDLILVEKDTRQFFSSKHEFALEMDIAHLKWTAWTLRRIYETNSDEKRAFALIGKPCYKFRYFKHFGINHNILLILHQLRLDFLSKIYVKLSKALIGKYIRKK